MDRKPELLNHIKNSVKSNAIIAGKAYRKHELDKLKPGALAEVKKSIIGPNKKARFKRWVGNGLHNVPIEALNIAKTGVQEGRANVIAGKIISDKISGKKSTKSENKFLGKQAINNVKTGVSVGAVVGANYLVGAKPAPGMSEAIAWGTHKIGMTPSKQRIPRRYRNHSKWNETNDWIDRNKKSRLQKKKEFNREFLKKHPELRNKKDTEHSYDPELNRDIRQENWININNQRMGQADKAISVSSKLAGGVIGGSLGNILGSKLLPKKKARLAYLISKGLMRTEKEDEELKNLKKLLSLVKVSTTLGGAALGATAGGVAYYKTRKKLDDKDRKSIWKT